MEEELERMIRMKQKYLALHGYNPNDPVLVSHDEEIEHFRHKIHHLEESIPENNALFTGVAFVSFNTEQEK